MADLISHINQANHNEDCALFIIDNAPDYRDWAITATFYAAVHLVEACFTTRRDIGHTESASGGREKHSFRREKVRILANRAYHPYRKLFEASNNVRYLTSTKSAKIAVQYYSEAEVRRFVKEHLVEIRTELEKAFNVNLH